MREKNINYYEDKLCKMVQNIILNMSDITKCLGKNLSDFTDTVGFSISAVSRIRSKVKQRPETALENLPYALCMFTALDATYLFEGIEWNTREKLEELLLGNICEESVLFRNKEGEPVMTNSLQGQHWYCMDYRADKGFMYQIQFLMSQINKMKEGEKLQIIKEEIMNKLQDCKVAFTFMGLENCIDELESIQEALKKLYGRDISQDNLYVSSLYREKVYMGDISEQLPDRLKECELHKDHKNDTAYIQDFSSILNECLQGETFLLLFVGNREDVKMCLSVLEPAYGARLIFAYRRYEKSTRQQQIVLEYKNNVFDLVLDELWNNYDSLFNSISKPNIQ